MHDAGNEIFVGGGFPAGVDSAYRRLVAQVNNLQRIMENPDAYF